MDQVKRPSVLVVEDDIYSKMLVNFILKDKANLIFAESALEAKNQLSINSVDMILLDISLKGSESGLDFVNHLRETETWKETPVIVITAHASKLDKKNCLDAGCNDYLTKPVTNDHLLNILERYHSGYYYSFSPFLNE